MEAVDSEVADAEAADPEAADSEATDLAVPGTAVANRPRQLSKSPCEYGWQREDQVRGPSPIEAPWRMRT